MALNKELPEWVFELNIQRDVSRLKGVAFSFCHKVLRKNRLHYRLKPPDLTHSFCCKRLCFRKA